MHHQRLKPDPAVAAPDVTGRTGRYGTVERHAGQQHQIAGPAAAEGTADTAQQPTVEAIGRNDAPQGCGIESAGHARQSGDGLGQQAPRPGTADHREARHGPVAREQVEHQDTQVPAPQHGIAAAPAAGPELRGAQRPEQCGRGECRKQRIGDQESFGHNCRFKSLATFIRNRCKLTGKVRY